LGLVTRSSALPGPQTINLKNQQLARVAATAYVPSRVKTPKAVHRTVVVSHSSSHYIQVLEKAALACSLLFTETGGPRYPDRLIRIASSNLTFPRLEAIDQGERRRDEAHSVILLTPQKAADRMRRVLNQANNTKGCAS
jgi:hypothetical protein